LACMYGPTFSKPSILQNPAKEELVWRNCSSCHEALIGSRNELSRLCRRYGSTLFARCLHLVSIGNQDAHDRKERVIYMIISRIDVNSICSLSSTLLAMVISLILGSSRS
jgi:hypothetical protein